MPLLLLRTTVVAIAVAQNPVAVVVVGGGKAGGAAFSLQIHYSGTDVCWNRRPHCLQIRWPVLRAFRLGRALPGRKALNLEPLGCFGHLLPVCGFEFSIKCRQLLSSTSSVTLCQSFRWEEEAVWQALCWELPFLAPAQMQLVAVHSLTGLGCRASGFFGETSIQPNGRQHRMH